MPTIAPFQIGCNAAVTPVNTFRTIRCVLDWYSMHEDIENMSEQHPGEYVSSTRFVTNDECDPHESVYDVTLMRVPTC